MKQLKGFIAKQGLLGLVRIVFYPITLLITSPFILLKTLWNCNSLFQKGSADQLHFLAYQACNNLFYKSRWINIKRYGLTGTSPHIGPGNVNLSRNFHYPMIALDLNMKYGGITILLSMLAWLGSHFIWINEVPLYWLSLTLALTFIGTLFYSSTFRYMNYNSLGWAVYPLFIYFLMQGNYVYAAGFFLLGSFGSVTATFIGIGLCTGLAVVYLDYMYLLVAIPAGIKLGTHLLPFLKPENRKSAATLKEGVGATSKVKYKRKASRSLGVNELYHLLIFCQFLVVYYYFVQDTPWLLIGCIAMYVVNARFVRFADVQSIYMAVLSTSIPLLLMHENWWLMSSFWLLSAPIPRIVGFYSYPDVLDRLPEMKPYSLKKINQAVADLIAPVNKGDKLFMAFKDPEDTYEKIYDGYRAIVEVVSWVCNEKYIHFIPDWWNINDNNFEGAQGFWGTTPETVKQNMRTQSCNYAIVYQNDGSSLQKEDWLKEGFSILKELDLDTYAKDFDSHQKMEMNNLKWWLVQLN